MDGRMDGWMDCSILTFISLMTHVSMRFSPFSHCLSLAIMASLHRYVFHYIVSDGLTYLCMTDSYFSRQVAFQFLGEIQKRFVGMMLVLMLRQSSN